MTRGLAAHFQARMLPLAAFAGLVVAAIPPMAYGAVAWLRLAAEARVDSEQVARAVRPVVERQPYLWRYNADKIVRATVLPGRRSRISITDCGGQALFPRGASAFHAPAGVAEGREDSTTAGRGPEAWAPIVSSGRAVAWVHARADLGAEWRALYTIIAGALLAGLAVAAMLFWYPVRVVRRQAERLAAAELTERVLAVQEEERRRIARDLHDGVGQQLAALELELEFARSRPDERDARLQAAIASCEATLAELRRVVHDLRPPELDGAEITEVLRGYTERFELRSKVPVSFRIEGTPRPPDAPRAACLLRVLQEALTNVGRHAQAKEVGVRLIFEPAQLSLEITDDGKGFDTAAPGGGTGLRGIRERVAFFGGSAEVTSSAEGTRLMIKIPT